MEQYRKKLKLENIFLGTGIGILILVQVLAWLRVITPAIGASWVEFWNGFIAGVSIALCALFLIGIITNIRALRDETHLKKLYVKQHDERCATIEKSAKSTGATIFLLAALLAGIIAGYFSITVFATIIICDVALAVICAAAKLYYRHSM